VKVFLFETDIVAHCNNRCAGCNRFTALREPWFMDPDALAHDLALLGKIATADKYIIIGGEPTLHPQLARIIRVVRASGIAPLVEMWTNGQLLDRMSDEVWRLLDSIVVDFYPGKVSREKQAAIRQKARDMGVALDVDHVGRFYRVYRAEPRTNAAEYFAGCPFADHCFKVGNGHIYRCPQSSIMPGLLLGLPEHVDGIALEGLTEDGLRAFLESKEPRRSCFHCVRDEALFDWHETTREKWLAESSIGGCHDWHVGRVHHRPVLWGHAGDTLRGAVRGSE
jgi:GTP 3',8-cyclase